MLVLAAPALADDLPELVPATITATSTLASNTNHYAAWQPFVSKAEDDRMWCEGKPDDGIGEALVVAFAAAVKLDAIELSAGVWKTEALFRANNVVTAIDVTTDDGRKLAFAFPDERKPVEMKLGGAPVKQLRFAIKACKKRELWGIDGAFEQPGITTERPGTITVGGYPNAWKLVLDGAHSPFRIAAANCASSPTSPIEQLIGNGIMGSVGR